MIYSAERFYETPLISHVACKEGYVGDSSVTLWFTVHNNFRQNNPYQGEYNIVSGANSANDTFSFPPYWREHRLEATVQGSVCDGTSILVTNQWGQSTNATFSR